MKDQFAENPKGFTANPIDHNQGFRMTFENGWTISVQWSAWNYCENREYNITGGPTPSHCVNAECAVWDKNGDWFRLGENDDVIGWQSPEQVSALISRVASFGGVDILDEVDTNLEKTQ